MNLRNNFTVWSILSQEPKDVQVPPIESNGFFDNVGELRSLNLPIEDMKVWPVDIVDPSLNTILLAVVTDVGRKEITIDDFERCKRYETFGFSFHVHSKILVRYQSGIYCRKCRTIGSGKDSLSSGSL